AASRVVSAGRRVLHHPAVRRQNNIGSLMIDQDRTPHGRLSDFQSVRALSEQICEPLAVEDYGLQARVETSPLKLHLAHTTWFFYPFVLRRFMLSYIRFLLVYDMLHNCYYLCLAKHYPRSERHLL